MVHVVGELVRQDDLDFIIGVFCQQRIRQENPPGPAKAGPGRRRGRNAAQRMVASRAIRVSEAPLAGV